MNYYKVLDLAAASEIEIDGIREKATGVNRWFDEAQKNKIFKPDYVCRLVS